MERAGSLFATALRAVLGLLALGLVLLALYVSLGRQLVPLVAEYRDDLAQQASDQLGLPVTIGALEGHWHAFSPIIVVRDIQLGEGNDSLRLERVRLTPDILASLMARQPRIDSLELEGLHLTLREDEAGKWHADGLPNRNNDTDPRKLIDMLLTPRRLSLMDSQLTVLPQQAKALSLNYVGMTLHSGSRQRLEARFSLPGGEPVAARLETRLDRDDWAKSSAQLYLSLPQADWAQWLPAGLTGAWKLSQAKAGGEFWATIDKGVPVAAVARLNAPKIEAALGDRPPVSLSDLGVGLFFKRSGDDFDLRVADLAANLGETRWGEVELELTRRMKGEEHWQLRADRLDLTPLGPTITALAPLPDKVIEWLDGLKPHGVLHNVNFDYWPQREDIDRVAYATNLEKVGVSAFHDVPAVANVDGTLRGNLGGGQLDANAQDFMLHLATLFPEPWHYRTAHTRMFFQFNDEAFTLGSHLMQVEGEEGTIAGDMLIRLMRDPAQEDYMDLRVGMSNGDARFTSKYLPTVIPQMSKDLAAWLKGSIKSGRIEQGYFLWQGSLQKGSAPEAHAMSLYFKVHDGVLDYQPGWPGLSKAEGEVRVEDSGVSINASSGRILNSQVRDVSVDIPHSAPGEVAHLHVDGDIDSNLVDGLKILQDSPIGATHTFAGWEGEGDLNGHLKLDIPLAKGEASKARVIVDFATDKARLKIAKPELNLEQVKGKFRFDTDSGLSGQNVAAQVLGTRVTGSIRAEGRNGDSRTRVLVGGQLPVKSLLDWAKVQKQLPVDGRIPFQLNLLLAGKDSQLQVASNLQGVTIDLPAPLGKAAQETRNSEWRMTLDGAERRYWAIYGDRASLAYAAPADQPLAGRGVLRLGGDPAVLPSWSGVQVRGKIDEVDADAWQAVLKKYSNSGVEGAAGLLRGADLQIGRFKGFGQTLENLTVDLLRVDSSWQLGLVSSLVSGKVTVPDNKARPIVIALDRIDLPKGEAIDSERAVEAPDPLAKIDPRSLPAMDVTIRQVLKAGQPVGAWSFNLRPTPTGTSFDNVALDLRGISVKGNLRWDGVDTSARSTFVGKLEGKNLGDVLKAWDFAPSVTSERFRVDINGNWPGSPAALSLRRFGGTLDASLRKGQFVEVEGGANALRVFGLLNFNAISRRLRLDFSDLLGKGLSYDRVKGVLTATDGVFFTREPLRLDGPSSNLELNGTLDLAHDEIDAKLLVTLPVTNNLPLAALIVGAPAIGGALFVVDKLLGDRVARFASVQYSVKGPWQSPTIAFEKPFEKPH
ncbi:TIGR02099 family protein [Pseudomonas sp. PDNC002]|uniref:YhdP family protein n=1 Tax=Pseudomonas sp. PDNC002 TaxID=2811422 RepID=UPI001965D57E|nr:YhdP family protein [Pseudomonas sp. PDNC002]QRY81547.1 TIGR02099 family protein [Pseudomonas sp. PDNC002]